MSVLAGFTPPCEVHVTSKSATTSLMKNDSPLIRFVRAHHTRAWRRDDSSLLLITEIALACDHASIEFERV